MKVHKNTENIVVVDLETTGLERSYDEILQIAIIDGQGNTILNEYIKPKKRKNWPKAQEKNGISVEMVKNSKGILEYADIIESAINNADVVVGYNLNDFDLPFLFSSGVEIKPKKTFDVMKAFAPIYGDYNDRHGSFAYKSLSVCARHYKYGEWKAHDALEDCKATLYCYPFVRDESQRKSSKNTTEPTTKHYRMPVQILVGFKVHSPKNWTLVLVLSIIVGFLGAHRFFVGKTGTGVLMILTAGCAGIWWIIDIVTVATGNFTDKQGQYIRRQT